MQIPVLLLACLGIIYSTSVTNIGEQYGLLQKATEDSILKTMQGIISPEETEDDRDSQRGKKIAELLVDTSQRSDFLKGYMEGSALRIDMEKSSARLSKYRKFMISISKDEKRIEEFKLSPRSILFLFTHKLKSLESEENSKEINQVLDDKASDKNSRYSYSSYGYDSYSSGYSSGFSSGTSTIRDLKKKISVLQDMIKQGKGNDQRYTVGYENTRKFFKLKYEEYVKDFDGKMKKYKSAMKRLREATKDDVLAKSILKVK